MNFASLAVAFWIFHRLFISKEPLFKKLPPVSDPEALRQPQDTELRKKLWQHVFRAKWPRGSWEGCAKHYANGGKYPYMVEISPTEVFDIVYDYYLKHDTLPTGVHGAITFSLDAEPWYTPRDPNVPYIGP